MNIQEIIRQYRKEGYIIVDAESKTAQDIILSKILKSKIYKNNLNNSKVNWLDINIDDTIKSILNYIEELSNEVIAV